MEEESVREKENRECGGTGKKENMERQRRGAWEMGKGERVGKKGGKVGKRGGVGQ